jgi:acetyl esterase/lipase
MVTAPMCDLTALPNRLRPDTVRFRARKSPLDRQAGIRVIHDVAYAGNAEVRNKLDLYLPDRALFPMVVFAHGGAWVSGDKALHASLGTFLARNGIGTAVVNYRLAPKVRHPAPAQDLSRAFAWTHEHISSYGGDPDRLYLCGHSAGGHLAALLGTNESFLAAEKLSFEHIRGVVAISGVYQIHWNITVAGLSHVFRDANKRAASPYWNIKAGCPPFLIVRAQKEIWTLSYQARTFHQRLLRHNCRSRHVVARGEDHYSIIQNTALPTAEHGKEILRFVHDG